MIPKPPKDWRFYAKWIGLALICVSLLTLLNGCEDSNSNVGELETQSEKEIPKQIEKPKTELEIAFDNCYDACWDKMDSTGGLLKGCYNNKDSGDITNLEYIGAYCNCLEDNYEDYCVGEVVSEK